MKFCPKDGALMMPAKVDERNVLRCPKCGHVEEITDKVRDAYHQKSTVGEDKRRGVMIGEKYESTIDAEELEEYRKQLLENLREAESERED